MKLGFLGFVAAALLLIGALGHPASASTIDVNPNPIDTFDVGKTKLKVGGFDITYEFRLFHNADLTYDIDTGNVTGFLVELRDASNNLISLNALAGDSISPVTYFFHVIGTSLGAGFFVGTVTLTATPVPPALVLFLTALGGMGLMAYRRRASLAV